MSEVPTENTSVRTSLPLREVRVVNWPLRDDPLRALSMAALCTAGGVCAGLVSASWSMGLVATLSLLLAVWRLWIPVVCDLGPAGMTLSDMRRRRHIAWRQIERVECGPRGVLLCGPQATAWAHGWRSLYLPWRHHASLVAEFHQCYAGAIREGIRSPDTSPR